MQFHETMLGQKIMPQIPTAIKNLASIDESLKSINTILKNRDYSGKIMSIKETLKPIANHYATTEKTDKPVDVLEAADAMCFNCHLRGEGCDTCPVTVNVQVVECNRKLELRYGPDINAKVFATLAPLGGIVYGYTKEEKSSELYDTALAAYEALVKEIDGDIFKD